jgi:UDP-2-acetamido-2-deoxy-ribo-hexuluronate aminotransferase
MQFIDLKSQYRDIKDDVDQRIQTVLDHGKYIMGPEIAELEGQLAEFVGVKHAIGCSSGTDALLISLMALDIGPGDEVITTPFSFFATAEVIVNVGATPVFVDIEPDTFNIDPNKIEAAITDKTKAIMPVSLYGQCADYTAINEIAAKHRLPVIEDGAQSFGATHHGKRSCGLTTIGCTSFFPSKPLGCYGDGGACFTDNDELATRLRQIRVHGQDKRYSHARIGVAARLDTIQAAILLAKLAVFPQEVEARQAIGARYSELLDGKVDTPVIRDENTSVYGQYTIAVDDRDAVLAAFKDAGIPTAVHYPSPMHLQQALAYLDKGEGSFPEAERAAKRVMSLPMHPYLDEASQKAVVAALEKR